MKATPCLFQQAFNYTTELPPLNITARYKSYDQIPLKIHPLEPEPVLSSGGKH